MSNLATWKELPEGGLILEPGTTEKYETGDWRSRRPIWNSEKCISCLICWIYCPELSISVEDKKKIGIDYKHCKGCGICANVCPEKVGAIKMIDEQR